MVQQLVSIPEKDLGLFLELVKKFKWKVEGQSKQQEAFDNFILTDKQLSVLKDRSKTPFNECVSKEDFFKFIDEL